jgi:DNA-binding transcriptional LysR family regulator
VAAVSTASHLASRRRLSWAELLKQPLILFPSGYYQRSRVDEAADRLHRWPKVAAEVESVAVMLELVRRDLGVATLLDAAVVGAEGVVPIPLPLEATVPIAICRLANARKNTAVEALLSHLIRSLGERA